MNKNNRQQRSITLPPELWEYIKKYDGGRSFWLWLAGKKPTPSRVIEWILSVRESE